MGLETATARTPPGSGGAAICYKRRVASPRVARTILLAGASGLTGGLALAELLARNEHDVVAVARRTLSVSDPRLKTVLAELGALEACPVVPAAAALCALGTTIKKAGSQAAFKAVDHDGVLAFARWARRGGARSFVLVSSVGASPQARNFYLRVKGETEQALAKLGFERLVLLRPSLLLGERGESRPGETVARVVAPALNPLLPGRFRRYRAITARQVSRALIAGAEGPPGQLIWEYDQLVTAAASLR